MERARPHRNNGRPTLVKARRLPPEVKLTEGISMIIIALSVALVLDASPNAETAAKLVRREIAAQDIQAASLVSVAVTLECTARASGKVVNCRVLGETHPGLGFSEAALALMKDATVKPGSADFQFARTIQFTP